MRSFSVLSNRFKGGKESGATLVEYGLIVGLIAIVAIVALTGVSDSIGNVFSTASTELQDASSAP